MGSTLLRQIRAHLLNPLPVAMEPSLGVGSSRQQQLSVTAADFQSTEAPGLSTAPDCQVQVHAVRWWSGAATRQVRWWCRQHRQLRETVQAVQRLSFNNTTTPQPAAALREDANARSRSPSLRFYAVAATQPTTDPAQGKVLQMLSTQP